MEYKKNSEVVKILFRMKKIEKNITCVSYNIKGIKVKNSSMENYKRCLSTYNEGSSYFFQCYGFLKSQYFSDNPSDSSKKFLISSLFIPAYKRFVCLNDDLAHIQVDDIYNTSLSRLKENVDSINSCLFELQTDILRI